MSTKVLAFAVVEFTDDDPPSLGVAPRCWLDSQPDGMFCYWPRKNISSKAKKSEMPDKERWARYPVRIMRHTESYDSAVSVSKTAQFTSNLSSDDEAVRKRVRKRRQLTDSDADDEEEGECLVKKAKSNTNNMNNGNLVLPSAPVYNGLSSSRNKPGTSECEEMHPDQTVAAHSNNRLVSENSAVPTCSSQEAIQPLVELNEESVQEPEALTSTPMQSTGSSSRQRIRRVLSDISMSMIGLDGDEHQTSIIDKLQEIITIAKRVENKLDILIGQKNDLDMIEDLLPAPVDTIEDFNRMGQELEEDGHRRKMVAFMTAFKGATLLETVRTMLKKTVSNSVLADFSLRGKKQKKPFQNHLLYKVIVRAVMKVHKVERGPIDDALIEVLKHAPHLPGGPKHIKKQTSTTRVEIDSD